LEEAPRRLLVDPQVWPRVATRAKTLRSCSTSGRPRCVSKLAGVQSLTLADLNGDGKPDIIALRTQYVGFVQSEQPANTTAVVDILLGTGGTGFQQPAEYPIPEYPESIAVADVNGDNKLDLIAVTASYTLATSSASS
jgi:hypothetical protein